MLHLDPFVLNLADPEEKAYLRVGVDLGLGDARKRNDSDGAMATSLARDTVLGVLALSKPNELLTPGGKDKLKSDLLRALRQRAPELGVQEVYSTSQVDKRKVGKLALAIQVAFQELGAFPTSSTRVPVDTQEPMPFSDVQGIENVDHTAALGRLVASPHGDLSSSAEDGDLGDLRHELEQALAPEISRKEVALRSVPDGLVVSLLEIGFFESGSAQIKSDSMPAFSRMARLLAQRKYRVRIEGHTDNIPIHNSRFHSNWELSTERATELVRVLMVQYEFAPERLSAAGYSQYHPVASNDSREGRGLNRRVDVVVLGRESVPHNAAQQPPVSINRAVTQTAVSTEPNASSNIVRALPLRVVAHKPR